MSAGRRPVVSAGRPPQPDEAARRPCCVGSSGYRWRGCTRIPTQPWCDHFSDERCAPHPTAFARREARRAGRRRHAPRPDGHGATPATSSSTRVTGGCDDRRCRHRDRLRRRSRWAGARQGDHRVRTGRSGHTTSRQARTTWRHDVAGRLRRGLLVLRAAALRGGAARERGGSGRRGRGLLRVPRDPVRRSARRQSAGSSPHRPVLRSATLRRDRANRWFRSSRRGSRLHPASCRLPG